MLEKFKPGTVPQYFVVKTLGDMAAANGGAAPRMRALKMRAFSAPFASCSFCVFGFAAHFVSLVSRCVILSVRSGVALTLRLRDILSRVIPVLGAVKLEPMKWVFVAGMAQ